MKMREVYLTTGESGRGPVILAGHDWGGLIGFRLASEAPILADRFIISNTFHTPIGRANIATRVASVMQMTKTFLHNPSNFRLLRAIYPTLKPIIRQLTMSGYVFVFRLPWPLSTILGRLGDFWFYRLLVAFSANNNTTDPIPGAHGWDMLASCLGPSKAEIDIPGADVKPTDDNPHQSVMYSYPIKSRASTGGWSEKVRLYRDGLAVDPWNKSLKILWELNQLEEASRSVSSSGSGRRRSGSRVGIFDIGPPGTFAAPTTILWGQKDVACNQAIAMDGVSDYFGVPPSHFITFPKVGHWTPHDVAAVDVWEAVIHWALKGEKETMAKLLERYDAAKLVLES